MENEDMLSSEVAREKEVTPATVRNWADRGILPAKRTANGVRIFSRRDVDAFVAPSRRSAKG